MTTIAVAGKRPGTRTRFSRGYAVSGVCHAVAAASVECGSTVTAECGQRVTVHAVWSPEAWPKMAAEAKRLPGYEHGICRRCVKTGADG